MQDTSQFIHENLAEKTHWSISERLTIEDYQIARNVYVNSNFLNVYDWFFF